jgi:5-methylcytosine-specific restriction endonuclease McrA
LETARGDGYQTARTRKKIRRTLAALIKARDGYRCVYCQRKKGRGVRLTLDHVVAHSEGGADTAANLVTCCMRCNVARGVNDIDLFAEWLRRRGIGDAHIEARVLRAISTPLPGAE